MDISYLGGGSLKISGKNLTAVSDPTDRKVKADVVVLTEQGEMKVEGMLVDGPGEYEVKGAMITGVPSGDATAYCVRVDGVSVGIVGGIAVLTDKQIEALGQIDVLALDGVDAPAAAKLVSTLEPKYAIPVGSDITGFLKEMGANPESISKLKLNPKEMPLETTVVVLQKS